MQHDCDYINIVYKCLCLSTKGNTKIVCFALAGVAQWIECWPVNQKSLVQ